MEENEDRREDVMDALENFDFTAFFLAFFLLLI